MSDWGTGFEGKITVTNGTSSPMNGWNVQFDLPSGFSIASAWDATQSRNGQHYTFTNPSWAPALAPPARARASASPAAPATSPASPAARSTARPATAAPSRASPANPAVSPRQAASAPSP
ncbi:cellulose binding domain-containing protein [Nonomuraea ferruginea]